MSEVESGQRLKETLNNEISSNFFDNNAKLMRIGEFRASNLNLMNFRHIFENK